MALCDAPSNTPHSASRLTLPLEWLLLERLPEETGYGLPLRCLEARTGLSPAYLRAAFLSLRANGFAVHLRGLFQDDGMVAGSGYGITKSGIRLRGVRRAIRGGKKLDRAV